MRVSLIAAVARNGVIGREGKLPWRLSDDLKRFKRLTTGHSVIMGRKTFESIGKPLPERRCLVISRQRELRIEGVTVVYSLDVALALCASEEEVFVIGGEEIYRLALPRADRLLLTRIERDFDGDAGFPAWSAEEFRETESEPHLEAEPPYRFVTLERCKATS